MLSDQIVQFADTSYGRDITRTSRISRDDYERQERCRCSSAGEWPTDDPGVPALGAAWWHACACVDADIDEFFVDRGESIVGALSVCARCPVRHECLDDALAREGASNQCHGVRGGLSGKARSRRWRTYDDGVAKMTTEDLHRLSDEVAASSRRRMARPRLPPRPKLHDTRHYLDVYLGWVEKARELRASRLILRDNDSLDGFDPGTSPVGAV